MARRAGTDRGRGRAEHLRVGRTTLEIRHELPGEVHRRLVVLVTALASDYPSRKVRIDVDDATNPRPHWWACTHEHHVWIATWFLRSEAAMRRLAWVVAHEWGHAGAPRAHAIPREDEEHFADTFAEWWLTGHRRHVPTATMHGW